jgi:AcrR family transcriptional regulator
VARNGNTRRGKGRLGQPRGSVPKEDRLDDIIEVATRLFRERGFRATRLDDISDALGVTRAALYYYFDGKQEVLEEVCARAMSSTEEALREVRALEDPADRLISFTRRYAANMSSDAARVFARENAELRPSFRRSLMARARNVNLGAEEILRYGIERGDFRADLDVRLTALGMLGMLNSLAEWYRPGRDGSLPEVTDVLVGTFIEGLRKPAPAARQKPGRKAA